MRLRRFLQQGGISCYPYLPDLHDWIIAINGCCTALFKIVDQVDAPESDTFYAEQALVAHPAVGESVAEMERPAVGAPAAPPDQSPATSHTPAGDRADTEADPHGFVPPLAAGLRPGSRAAMTRVPSLPRAITDPDHVPFYGKPPPAVSA